MSGISVCPMDNSGVFNTHSSTTSTKENLSPRINQGKLYMTMTLNSEENIVFVLF